MHLFVPPLFLEVESFLEVVHYSFICGFGMTVAFWVSGGRGVNLDFPFHVKFVEHFGNELWSVVGYYFVW